MRNAKNWGVREDTHLRFYCIQLCKRKWNGTLSTVYFGEDTHLFQPNQSWAFHIGWFWKSKTPKHNHLATKCALGNTSTHQWRAARRR